MSPQILVVYDYGSKKGIVYDTAYDDHQVKDVVCRCVAVHGKDANVRMVLASSHHG